MNFQKLMEINQLILSVNRKSKNCRIQLVVAVEDGGAAPKPCSQNGQNADR